MSSSSALSPRSLRAAFLLAVLLALATVEPAHALRWWKWKNGHGGHGERKEGHAAKLSSHDSSSDDDGNSGKWWKAKGADKADWWSKRSDAMMTKKKRNDGSSWVPGTGLRVARCILHECAKELKMCRKDSTCRDAVQCTLGRERPSEHSLVLRWVLVFVSQLSLTRQHEL